MKAVISLTHKTPHFDWSEKQYWMHQIIVSAILFMYVCIYLNVWGFFVDGLVLQNEEK